MKPETAQSSTGPSLQPATIAVDLSVEQAASFRHFLPSPKGPSPAGIIPIVKGHTGIRISGRSGIPLASVSQAWPTLSAGPQRIDAFQLPLTSHSPFPWGGRDPNPVPPPPFVPNLAQRRPEALSRASSWSEAPRPKRRGAQHERSRAIKCMEAK